MGTEASTVPHSSALFTKASRATARPALRSRMLHPTIWGQCGVQTRSGPQQKPRAWASVVRDSAPLAAL